MMHRYLLLHNLSGNIPSLRWEGMKGRGDQIVFYPPPPSPSPIDRGRGLGRFLI